ncbi:MAG: amino acid permease [Deltaproteobacteria bacterium]|nr:amino acid permease [Deltaproteobacteria bacterium]
MPTQSASERDAEDLRKMGYAQELFRQMGGFSNFAISFSVISILTGAIQLYGYGLQHGGPLVMTVGWWLVSVFTMSVALSMAELASAYPTAGALYHWSSILGGKAIGWFTACFNTIGQFAILAGIDYGLALLLRGYLKLPPDKSVTMALYAALLLSHATLNHFGIRVVAWLNNFSAWYHIAVVALVLVALLSKGLAQPASFLLTPYSTDSFPYPYSFLLGLLLAQWTLTGYDASAHVCEETIDPRRRAPWGIFLSVAISVVAGAAMISVITLSIPNLPEAAKLGDDAFTGILRMRLGEGLGNAVVGLVLGAMWLCGVSSLTSASRMVYAFARDGGLPWSSGLARVSPKHRTPSNAIWLLAFVALLISVKVELYSAIVSIATIALYVSYGLPIAAGLYARGRGTWSTKGPWNLGRLSPVIACVAMLWIVFIIGVFVLPPNEQAGQIMAACTVALTIAWFGFVRSRFPGPRVTIQHYEDEPALASATPQ